MTSKCTKSAPASTTARTSSPRRAKSDDSSDGAMRCWIMAYNFRERSIRAAVMGHDTTHISVEVKTAFLDDRSDPSRNQYVFAYTVTLTNHGDAPAQLISRHWIITDAENKIQEVKGLGVVGQQPLIK